MATDNRLGELLVREKLISLAQLRQAQDEQKKTNTTLGYALAKMSFPGKRLLFSLVMVMLMVPGMVTFVPTFILVANMGLMNTYPALILPHLVSPLGVFLMRQFIPPVPNELIDAARMDGAGDLRIFVDIILPQLKPALATVGLLTFVFQFNEFLWPLIVVSTTEMRPITTGLTLFNQ